MHRNTRRFVGALAVCAIGLATPALAHTDPSDPGHRDVTVNQGNFNSLTGGGWAFAPDGDPRVPSGTAELVAGPSVPPSGSGSLRLYNTDAGQLTTVSDKSDFAGLRLSDVTVAKYATYVDPDSAPGSAQIALKFGVPGTTLVFEPYYSDNARASQYGVWHSWDAAAAPTGWWDTRSLTSCSMAKPCSFTALKQQIDPTNTMTLNDARFGIGRGTSNFDGNVDLFEVKIAGHLTRYDFESNAIYNDVMTRVDQNNGGGWTFDGETGTAPGGSFDVHFTAGPTGATGGASVSLNNSGAGSYSSIQQDYFEGNGDVTQQYLGSLDNIEADTYKLASSTNGDYPTVRFEVRIPDPTTKFAFTSIVNVPAGTTANGGINQVKGIHDPSSAADSRTWYLSDPAGGLNGGFTTAYTWAEVMHSSLRDAVILKARVMSGRAGSGAFHGGVDLLRFSYRDGSSQTWDFQTTGYPVTTIPAAPTALTATAVATSSNVSLTWVDNAGDEVGQSLQRSTTSTFAPGTLTNLAVGRDLTSYTDTGLTAGTHYYRVAAYNSAGVSAYSNTASATTTANPPPQDVTAPTVAIATSDASIFVPYDPITGQQTYTDIAGTASDAIGVSAVSVKVQDAFGNVVTWPVVCGAYGAPACEAVAPGGLVHWVVRLAIPALGSLNYVPGTYTVTAYAVDAAGNLGTSASISIVTVA